MPANEWNIRIVTAFQPRVPGGTPGSQLLVQAGDVVTWGNDTTQTHQPWPLDANGNPVPAANPEIGYSRLYVGSNPAGQLIKTPICNRQWSHGWHRH